MDISDPLTKQKYSSYLIIPPNRTDYRETQWMPLTETFLNAEAPETAAYPPKGELIFNDTAVPKKFLEGPEIPRQWMKIATEENRRRIEALKHIKNPTVDDFAAMKDEGGLGWLWGRRLVEFGDSIDREEVEYFCHEFGSEMIFPKLHHIETRPKGVCSIPAFNLTFFAEMCIIPFEERWKPHENPINGPRGRPDLIFFQNGLWDQRGFQVSGQKYHQDDNSTLVARHRKMTWDELHCFSARLRLFLQRLEKEFPDTPMIDGSLWKSVG
uniref:WGS project CBMI000000000 data, contig CS3069_c001210 n=1 Tax=Fusarium clavum TaxID=2594811 RepID=A0A090N5F9_9HYPO|nr:unnamed protein product [Fusarium clavum]